MFYNLVNFARKAASGNSFRCFGLSCSNGAALVTAVRDDENIEQNSEEKSNSKPSTETSGTGFLYKKTRILRDAAKSLFKIDASLSVALTGIPSDCRHVLSMLRKEAQDHRSNFCEPISLGLLADRVSSYLHELTLSSDTRPLAVTILLGAR